MTAPFFEDWGLVVYSRVRNKHTPTFINFWNFFQGLRSYYGLKRLKFYWISLHILRGYVYSFSHIFQRLRLFKGLRLFRTLEYRYFYASTFHVSSISLELVFREHFLNKKFLEYKNTPQNWSEPIVMLVWGKTQELLSTYIQVPALVKHDNSAVRIDPVYRVFLFGTPNLILKFW